MSPDHWKCQLDKSARSEAEMSVLVSLSAVEHWQPFLFLSVTERKDRVIHGRELFDFLHVNACCWIEFDDFHLINTSFQKVSHLNLMA